MGTDMHVMVEVSHHDEPWRPITGGPTGGYKAPRNYPLFSLLANMNNRAGLVEKTWQEPRSVPDPDDGHPINIDGFWYDPDNGGHDTLIPIAPPRGTPEDASLDWKGFVAMWQAMGANPITTWLTPDEVINANLDQPIYKSGVVLEEEYLALRDDHKFPSTYSEKAGGTGVRIVTEEEYEAGERGEKGTFVQTEWMEGTLHDVPIVVSFQQMCRELEENRPSTSKIRFMLLFES
jgi:hypothetical protein